MGRHQHRFHGDPERFDVVAEFIATTFSHTVNYIADVAGGQGLLSRILKKKYQYESEVIDPRGWALRGVQARQEHFSSSMAEYYDLIVGLHPDEALREVAAAGLIRPTIVVPCCNFWQEERLGRDALVAAIREYFEVRGVPHRIERLSFRGPHNIAVITAP
jgi:hypothetical protein